MASSVRTVRDDSEAFLGTFGRLVVVVTREAPTVPGFVRFALLRGDDGLLTGGRELLVGRRRRNRLRRHGRHRLGRRVLLSRRLSHRLRQRGVRILPRSLRVRLSGLRIGWILLSMRGKRDLQRRER